MSLSIDAIRKRLEDCPIPENAQADYAGTNHYEIQAPSADGFWWLEVYDLDEVDSSTEQGKRVGAVLDYACAYRRDVGALLERIAELEVALEPGKTSAIVGAVFDLANQLGWERCSSEHALTFLRRRIAGLEAVQTAAIKMLEDLDNATGPDEWSTSELRAALDAAGEKAHCGE